MLLALLAIWTKADYSWPKTLVLCRRQEMVWCRQPIGAHGAFVCGARDALVCVVCGWRWSSCASGERSHSDTAFSYCGPQSWSACACVCARVRIRVYVTGGVLARGLTYVGRLSEQRHWRWPNQGAAVAKQGGLAR